MNSENKNSLLIIIEDSEEDVFAIKRSLKNIKHPPIKHYSSGEDALGDLIERKKYFLAHDLIFVIDVNLPGISGQDTLKKIKDIKGFALYPAVILTSSASNDEINISYKNGANSFIKKHASYEKFSESIQLLKSYWFDINLLPKNNFNKIQ